MAQASIPVDLFNPGQVFGCLGFLEAADILRGHAEGGFDWANDADTRFTLKADGDANPFAEVLEFLVEAEPWPVEPESRHNDNEEDAAATPSIELSPTFPAEESDRMALPIRFGVDNRPTIELGHWADGSSRWNFKLYSGIRSADKVAGKMLCGDGKKKTKGIAQLWKEDREELISRPFDVLTPMGGSFNFDPRGAWTAIDSGYSPNKQGHAIQASPVVEFLAAWGLEHARPVELDQRQVRYAAWRGNLSPPLARVALIGGLPMFPFRSFRFELGLSGKNKVVTFAQEEPTE